MAYNELLHNAIALILKDEPGFSHRKMFGGVGYMIHGNMACGVTGDELFLRLSPADIEELCQEKIFRSTSLGVKPMKGWLSVDLGDIKNDDQLRGYVMRAVAFAAALPPK